MITRCSLAQLLAGTALVTAIAAPAAADWRDDVSVVRIATAASDDEAARRARYEPVAEFLSERLGVDVELIVTSEHAATAEAFLNGFVEVADMGTQAYAIMHEQAPGSVRPFATQLNEDGSLGYNAAILTRADNDEVDDLMDLEGKTVAFPSQSSNSGTIAPMFFLANNHDIEDLDAFFGDTTFSGSHNNSVLGVVQGTYDAAFVWYRGEDNNAARSLVDRGEVSEDDLKWVWISPSMPTNPWVVSTELPQEAQDEIIAAIMAMNEDGSDALDAMSEGTSAGLAEVSHEDYLDIIAIRDFAMQQRRN